MIVAAHLVPLWLSVAVGAVMLICVAAAALTADWPALRAASERQHVLLGGLLALFLLWLLTLRVIEDVWIHLLGVTSLTLIVGWRFTVLGATLVLFGYLWWEQQPLMAAPLAWLFSVLVPATTTRILAHVLRRYGLRNLFVYMLGAGFGGGLLSVLVLALLALSTFWLIGQSDWVDRALENWPFILLLMFPEGFINGMLVTAFTVFYPDVVKTFDDDYYLGG
ncbi:MAG: energy-coupling factor ABC transporter permease [Pseudomonadales bacterium]|jgi:uncharacterized membrane protein